MVFASENLDVFFPTDETVLVGPEFEETEIRAIYSIVHQAVGDAGHVDVSSAIPSLLVKAEDVSDLDIRKRTRVVHNDVAYYVGEVRPDSPGISRLILLKA